MPTTLYTGLDRLICDFQDCFRVADHLHRTSSLRFPEPRLRWYRESSRAPRKGKGITPRSLCFLAGETTSSPCPLYFFSRVERWRGAGFE